jgi:hypothetical protein
VISDHRSPWKMPHKCGGKDEAMFRKRNAICNLCPISALFLLQPLSQNFIPRHHSKNDQKSRRSLKGQRRCHFIHFFILLAQHFAPFLSNRLVESLSCGKPLDHGPFLSLQPQKITSTILMLNLVRENICGFRIRF